MTGFGAGSAPCGASRVVVEIRSVNHRFFDARIRAQGALADLGGHVEDKLRRAIARGRVDVSLRLERTVESSFDRARLVSLARELASIRDEVAPNEPLPWTLLASLPDASARVEFDAETLRASLDEALALAVEALDSLRAREGFELRVELERWLDSAESNLASIEAEMPSVVARHQQKLKDRVAHLLGPSAPSIDPGRLAQEIALLADRMDVTEELARARAHLGLFRATIAADEAVGRKLDFVSQELLREANTIGSKNADAAISHRVIDLKADIERLREQVQNVL